MNPTEVNRTFVLEKQSTGRIQFVEWPIPTYSAVIDLKKVVEKVESPENKQFKIYYAETDSYIPFEEICIQPYMIPAEYLELQIIMIKYADYEGVLAEQNNSEDENKKQRSKQRTIGEVIELVREWRSLHSTVNKGKRVNLQQAAKIVGISKKSLDDYFYQLRVGEKHQFEFNEHLNDKIGVLRNFIKGKEPERKTKDKHAKHPKKLKIIEEFENFAIDSFTKIKELEEKQLKKENIRKIDDESEDLNQAGLFWGNPYGQISRQSLLDCENHFLNGFKFDGEEDDPFLLFNQRRNSELENSSQNIFNSSF